MSNRKGNFFCKSSTRNENMAAVRDQIILLKKKLERENDISKLLSALQKLNNISVTVELLQETGVGKTIKSMRKKSGDVGRRANGLYAKWKEVVEKNRPSSVQENNRSQKDISKKTDSNVSRTLTVEREDSYTVYDGNGNDSQPKKKTSDGSDLRAENSKPKTVEMSNKKIVEKSSKHKNPVSNGYKSSQTNVKQSSSKTNDPIQIPSKNGNVSSDSGKSKHRDKERLSSKKVKSHHKNEKKESPKKTSSKSKKQTHTKTKKIKSDEDGFDATMVSFEDCLGLSDIKKVPVKRKLNSSPTIPSPKPKSSSVVKSKKSHSLIANIPPYESDNEGDNEVDIFSSPKYNSPEVDISCTLPSIQPNYKPVRYNILDSPPRKKKSGLLHEVDTSIFMSSKHNRTQVFSGRRANCATEITSLYELCIRVLQDNIDALAYTGGVPFDQLKPVLQRCTPQQLYQIEDYNPYLLEDTDGLWMSHCQQDFKGQKPGEFETWREFYLRRFDEREAKLKSITANISASMAKALPVRQTKLAYVDTVAKPPRSVARTQMKFGTGLPVGAAQKAGVPSKATPRRLMPGMTETETAGPSVVKAQVKKVAPLMQRTLKLMKNRFRR